MRRLLLLLLACLPLSVYAQTSSEVDNFTAVTPVLATDMYNDLGINVPVVNVNGTYDVQPFALAAAAGMKYVRTDCPWNTIESATSPGTYSFAGTSCAAAMQAAKANGQTLYINALYGPAVTQLGTATTTAAASTGAASIPLSSIPSVSPALLASGQILISIDGARGPYAFSLAPLQSQNGSLVTSISTGAVTLATPISTTPGNNATFTLPSGSAVTFYQLLYPPVLVAPGTSLFQNPSLIAFGNYVKAIAQQCQSVGVKCVIGLWNESPWNYDSWNNAAAMYVTPPANGNFSQGPYAAGVPLPLLALYLSQQPSMAGVQYDNGYTQTGGMYGSLLFPDFQQYQQDLQLTVRNFAVQSHHPYGYWPEQQAWNPACMQANALAGYGWLGLVTGTQCSSPSEQSSTSFKYEQGQAMLPGNLGGIHTAITENGIQRSAFPGITEARVSAFNLRGRLTDSALGYSPYIAYTLTGNPDFDWCSGDTVSTCYPVYTAFQRLQTLLGTIANPPVSPPRPCMMPSVSSYSGGSYPLAAVSIVGATPGAKGNSILFNVWQQSNNGLSNWATAVPSPPAATVTVKLPPNATISQAVDLVTGAAVSYTQSGNTATVQASDEPIALMMALAGPQYACN